MVSAALRRSSPGRSESSGVNQDGKTLDRLFFSPADYTEDNPCLDKRSRPEINHSHHRWHISDLAAGCNLALWIEAHVQRKPASVLFKGYLRHFGAFGSLQQCFQSFWQHWLTKHAHLIYMKEAFFFLFLSLWVVLHISLKPAHVVVPLWAVGAASSSYHHQEGVKKMWPDTTSSSLKMLP